MEKAHLSTDKSYIYVCVCLCVFISVLQSKTKMIIYSGVSHVNKKNFHYANSFYTSEAYTINIKQILLHNFLQMLSVLIKAQGCIFYKITARNTG